MRETIIKLGRVKTIIVIALIAIIGSVLVFIPIGYLLLGEIHPVDIIIAMLIPMIISPIISWYTVGLIFKIHNLEVKMRELATFDSLTKVMSRKAFLTNALTIYELMQRNKLSLAILYIDIDNFKNINDTYGHIVGDEVLKDFGHILKEYKRGSDLVGRLGGEEFAIVLPKTDVEGATTFADNLRKTVNNSIVKYKDITISYTISIGISVLDQNNHVDFNNLIKQSDEALYFAKNSGKNCTKLYDTI